MLVRSKDCSSFCRNVSNIKEKFYGIGRDTRSLKTSLKSAKGHLATNSARLARQAMAAALSAGLRALSKKGKIFPTISVKLATTTSSGSDVTTLARPCRAWKLTSESKLSPTTFMKQRRIDGECLACGRRYKTFFPSSVILNDKGTAMFETIQAFRPIMMKLLL
jgi:hypothetical protein